MLYWNQVWRRVHELAGVHIEKRAVMEVIWYAEEQIDLVIKQSMKELERKNKFCETQGLRQKQRIDRGCVMDAIKSINNNGHSFPSERTGGKTREAKTDKHSQENTEVA